MRVKMRTIMAHPKHGIAHPSQVVDLPDDHANQLIAGGFADRAAPAPPAPETAGAPETAATAGAPENAMAPRPRAKKG
jgi:hypothetical protein